MSSKWTATLHDSFTLAPSTRLLLSRKCSLFGSLPPKEVWVKRGMVERRTVHANVIWMERQLILTNDCIFFARANSDLVVDKISVENIVFLAKMNPEATTLDDDDSEVASPFDALDITGTFKAKSTQLKRRSILSGVSSSGNLQGISNFRRTFAFEIKTCVDGNTRSYFVRVRTLHDCDDWIASIRSCIRSTLREHSQQLSWIQRRQQDVLMLQSDLRFRLGVFIAILLDFILSILESEFHPDEGSSLQSAFGALDSVLLSVFSLELLLSAFSSWTGWMGWGFMSRMSHWFQTATVLFQLFAFIDPRVHALRVFRILRIFHIGKDFQNLASCQMILKAIKKALVPVSSALVILFFVTAIFSVISVSWFGDQSVVNFGSFSLALFSMFQVSTTDGWAREIARPLAGNFEDPTEEIVSVLEGGHNVRRGGGLSDGFYWSDSFSVLSALGGNDTGVNTTASGGHKIPAINWAVGLYFVLFYFATSVCLLGVVHAILLDEFMLSMQEERRRRRDEEIDAKFLTSAKLESPLDPLLASLAHFHSSDDLSRKIRELFELIDFNGSGSLDYKELRNGLLALEGCPVRLSLEDLDTLSENKALCNEEGELDLAAFERLIRHQLQLYVMRILAAAMEKAERDSTQAGAVGNGGGEHAGVVLFVLKLLVANTGQLMLPVAVGRTSSAASVSRIRTHEATSAKAASARVDCDNAGKKAFPIRGGSSAAPDFVQGGLSPATSISSALSAALPVLRPPSQSAMPMGREKGRGRASVMDRGGSGSGSFSDRDEWFNEHVARPQFTPPPGRSEEATAEVLALLRRLERKVDTLLATAPATPLRSPAPATFTPTLKHAPFSPAATTDHRPHFHSEPFTLRVRTPRVGSMRRRRGAPASKQFGHRAAAGEGLDLLPAPAGPGTATAAVPLATPAAVPLAATMMVGMASESLVKDAGARFSFRSPQGLTASAALAAAVEPRLWNAVPPFALAPYLPVSTSSSYSSVQNAHAVVGVGGDQSSRGSYSFSVMGTTGSAAISAVYSKVSEATVVTNAPVISTLGPDVTTTRSPAWMAFAVQNSSPTHATTGLSASPTKSRLSMVPAATEAVAVDAELEVGISLLPELASLSLRRSGGNCAGVGARSGAGSTIATSGGDGSATAVARRRSGTSGRRLSSSWDQSFPRRGVTIGGAVAAKETTVAGHEIQPSTAGGSLLTKKTVFGLQTSLDNPPLYAAAQLRATSLHSSVAKAASVACGNSGVSFSVAPASSFQCPEAIQGSIGRQPSTSAGFCGSGAAACSFTGGGNDTAREGGGSVAIALQGQQNIASASSARPVFGGSSFVGSAFGAPLAFGGAGLGGAGFAGPVDGLAGIRPSPQARHLCHSPAPTPQ